MLLSRFTFFVLLLEKKSLLFFPLVHNVGALIIASFDAFFSIVPGTTSVTKAEGDLDTAHNNSRQETV